MGSEGSIGSIRSAGSGQSTEGTNGQSTSILIENVRVGASARSPRAAPPGLPWAGDGAPAKEGICRSRASSTKHLFAART